MAAADMFRPVRRAVRTPGFQDVAGYARAVRVGGLICVSGTAPAGREGEPLSDDLYDQTRDALTVAVGAVEELGGAVGDVVRTRLFLAPDADWEKAVVAHREFFAEVTPANTTLFVHGFIPPGVLVEVELDAFLA